MTKVTTIHGYDITHLFVGAVCMAMALFPFAGIAYAHDGSGSTESGVEINIGANGNALVRGAKVTNVSSSQINANTSYGLSVLNWIVKIASSTEFVTHGGADVGLTGIAVGDTISFRGTLDQALSGLTVNAKVVKDWTHVETKRKLAGIVTSINATLNSFTLLHDLPAGQAGNSTTTVQTNSSTDFDLSNGENGTFASLFLNAKVKVKGMFNASSSVLTAMSVDIATTTKHGLGWNDDDRKAWRNWIRSKVWLNLWDR